MGAFEAAEELFEDVVGALGLDQDGAGGSLNGNGIGKKLLPVFIDLCDHFLSRGVLRIVFAADQPGAERLHTFFDAADVALLSLVIEAMPARCWSDAHGFSQLLKDGDLFFNDGNRLPKRPVLDDLLQVQVYLEVRLVVLPLAAQLDGLELFHFGSAAWR